MRVICTLITTVFIAVACLGSSRKLLHIFQLESYQLPGYIRSILRSRGKLLIPGIIATCIGLITVLFKFPAFVSAVLEGGFGAAYWKYAAKQKQKKAYVITERVKRFIAIHFGVAVILSLFLNMFGNWYSLLLPIGDALILAIASYVAAPMEKRINDQFARDAAERLDAVPGLVRIGITGSYGKTSTKFLLKEILSVKWKVLATPGSFNTTMGVTRVIREMLTPGCQVFIAEMGARHPGDIRELVELVHPTIGILTSIGPQHLDTFGSIEGVAAAKKELIDGLPTDGTAVIAHDEAWCTRVFNECRLAQKYLADTLLRADSIEVGPWGTRFILLDTETNETVKCSTKLLGRHSINNLMLCCTVAKKMGMTLQEISVGISHCKPVEHRLQLLDAGLGITIIDDAFNSNPAGAKAAMDVLAAFPGRRIVVTPGMVELGDQEEFYNKEFGKQIANSADVVFLIGEQRTRPIANGLTESGFEEKYIYTVKSLDEARDVMRTMLHTGDVVLYENDLPDNY